MSRKEDIKDLFTFTKGERKGIFVLIILLICVLLINLFYNSLFKRELIDYSVYEKEILEFEKGLVPISENIDDTDGNFRYDTLVLFKFNPNNTSKAEFLRLGLTEKQANIIINYRSKGGKFYQKSDFSRIYTITSEQYQALYPFIDLPENTISQNVYESNSRLKNEHNASKKHNLFKFDPNTITDSEWLDLGFSENQVSVIRNFINKGGKFNNKEDLKNIYVINEKKYKEIEDYIIINSADSKKTQDNNPASNLKSVDINSYSINDFNELGGSWKYFANRIVKYRELLGGYFRKEQLLEVYGMNNDFYNSISDIIYIDQTKIKQININFAEVYDLKTHPYLSEQEAKSIIYYRNKNGAYKDLMQLKTNNIISAQLFEKVSPYLIVK